MIEIFLLVQLINLMKKVTFLHAYHMITFGSTYKFTTVPYILIRILFCQIFAIFMKNNKNNLMCLNIMCQLNILTIGKN